MCILCVLLYENYDDLLAYPYQNNELILICKHNAAAAAAMGEDRAKASKWRRRAEARASDTGLSVCKHERREDENEKVYRKGKQCRQQWCWPAAAAATSLGKKSRKIPQLIYVISRTMALLLMQSGSFMNLSLLGV